MSWLVRRYVEGKSDITPRAREQYRRAIPHIESELGAIPLPRRDRDDVARWIGMLTDGGKLSRRIVQNCRNVLPAALADAVVAVNRGAVLGDPKNVRSRRLVPLSTEMVRTLNRRPHSRSVVKCLGGSS